MLRSTWKTTMTKTTTPKAPRLTKAQKAEQAAIPAIDLSTVVVTMFEPEAPEVIEQAPEVIEQAPEVLPEDTWVDPIAWVDETPTIDQAMAQMPKVKSMKVVKTVKTGVGAQILQHIADGVLSNKEIVAKVLADNPLRKTTYACVAWYQSQVKAGKIDLPEAQEEVMMTEEELANEEQA